VVPGLCGVVENPGVRRCVRSRDDGFERLALVRSSCDRVVQLVNVSLVMFAMMMLERPRGNVGLEGIGGIRQGRKLDGHWELRVGKILRTAS
jgi:hypothetical protein